MDALLTIATGSALVLGALVVPGLLVVRWLLPGRTAGEWLLAGSATGLLLVPTLAFGAALLFHVNLAAPTLIGTGLVVAGAAVLGARLGPAPAKEPDRG